VTEAAQLAFGQPKLALSKPILPDAGVAHMSYWKRVLRRAALEAAKDAKVDTLASATIHLIVQAVVSVIIWVALGHVLPPGTLWARIRATTIPLLTFPIAMGVRVFTVPADMAQGDEAQIKSLTLALD
jgi:hypothetical protein